MAENYVGGKTNFKKNDTGALAGWVDSKGRSFINNFGANGKKGKRGSNTFQNFFYSYGKTTGTLKQVPGLRNFSLVQKLAAPRNFVYPAARFMGNAKAAQSFIQTGDPTAIINRAGAVGIGKLSGLGINALVAPLNLGPLTSRFARIAIGKGLSSNKRFRNFQTNALSIIRGKLTVNGQQANQHMKRQFNIVQQAQMMMVQTEMAIRANAPDVASGQYLLGMTEGPKKYQNQVIDFDRMLKKSEFNKFGIRSLAPEGSKNKYEFRDIFGFSKPGQSYLALVNSIVRHDMKPTIGQTINKGTTADPDWDKGSFFDGSIEIGGSPNGFPWIWAVEYGGNLPYYQRTDSPDKDGFAGHYTGRSKGDMYIPKNKYVHPTFFITRAVKATSRMFKKQHKVHTNISVGMKGSQKAYSEWLKIAKQRNQKTALKKYKPDRLKYGKSTDFLSERYSLDVESRGAGFLSQMENKIPGPRIESAHGSFYNKELAAELGLKVMAEDMNISMSVPLRKNDSQRVVSQAAKVFIEAGGGQIKEGGRKYNQVFKKVGNYLATQAEYKNAPKRLLSDTERFMKIFNNMNMGENTAQGQRRAQLLKEVYNLSTKTEGNKLIITARKRRSDAGKSKKTGKRPYVSDRSYKSIRGEQLAKDIASSLDVDELFNTAVNMDFDV